MQAIILAAGMGKRLKELTNDNTKCMVKVNGVTLIERMLKQLDDLNLSGIILVVGYKSAELKDYISTLSVKTPIQFIENEIYYKTNNIYSLFLARNFLLKEDTILLESDLIFEDSVLRKIIDDPYPSLALVAKYESWMDGTVVTIDNDNNILSFLDKKHFKFKEIKNYFKTVNIYKFSKSFSNSHYVPFLEAYCKALGDNEYYEQVLKVITLLEKPEIKASVLDVEEWYEIDDLQDLDIAESIFTQSPDEKLIKFQKRYGGYWRYPNLIDFCYLVNPFYPTTKLLDEIKANFERLIVEYPSGMNVNCLLAAKYFGIKQDNIVVGNGAAELIKSLFTVLDGKIGMIFPTFEEYPNRIDRDKILPFYPKNKSYQYEYFELIEFFSETDIKTLLLINPDNPSGNFILKDDLIKLAHWTNNQGIKLIVDESFVDFANVSSPQSILCEDIISTYPNLIVIKSISKSYGVPGLRLGILATSQKDIVNYIKKDVSIWNINSFAEFFLQIFEKYKTDYENAINSFRIARDDFYKDLESVKYLRVVPSHANYFLCEILYNRTAKEVTRELLNKYNLLVKDLTDKNGFSGEYIRIAVKNPLDNKRMIEALSKMDNNN